MNRINQKFNDLKDINKAALVCYLTAGDPDIGLTTDIVLKLEESGADIVEIGVPFSDPMADGPTIQLASERALENNVSLRDVLETVQKIRKNSEVPIIIFGYYNPFYIYGLEKFAQDAKKAGVDGVLVVDLPPEEAGEFKQFLDAKDVDLIFLLAPTSNEERIELVSKNASGFIYLVSVTGVTGSRPNMDYSLENLTHTISDSSKLPVGIGFGVSSPDQAREISSFADAVIVGSALVKIIEKNGNNKEELLKEVKSFISSLSEGCFRK